MMVKKARRAEEIVQFASMWNMDGIVVIGFCEQDYALLRSRMRIPFAVYDGLCRAPQRFLNLTIDNFDGGRQVGQHFRALRARLAVEKLRELKEGRPVETEIMLPVSLVVRNSTAPCRG